MSKKTEQVDLAAQLRRAIRDAGLNPFQVSKRADIAYAAIHGFMNGGRDMFLSTASKISTLLGLELRSARKKTKGR